MSGNHSDLQHLREVCIFCSFAKSKILLSEDQLAEHPIAFA